MHIDSRYRSQQRLPIQVFEEAKDSITSIVISDSLIVTGSVDGHVRTYDIRMGELRTDFYDRQSFPHPFPNRNLTSIIVAEPVTSLQLSVDQKMLLVSTLDSTLRTMDPENGQLFQSYRGHKNESYRSKATFGNGEATVVFGDENGQVWTWDIETVRTLRFSVENIADVFCRGRSCRLP